MGCNWTTGCNYSQWFISISVLPERRYERCFAILATKTYTTIYLKLIILFAAVNNSLIQ